MSNLRFPVALWDDLNFPIIPRLKRVTATGAAPAANPWVGMLQAHIQMDTIGSSQITSK
jgi:hypothetical protein